MALASNEVNSAFVKLFTDVSPPLQVQFVDQARELPSRPSILEHCEPEPLLWPQRFAERV